MREKKNGELAARDPLIGDKLVVHMYTKASYTVMLYRGGGAAASMMRNWQMFVDHNS